MEVNSMSMQMIVPRAADAGQVQHNLNQANALQADYQALEQKNDDKLKQKQVRGKENPEDGRKNRGGGYHNKRKMAGTPTEETEEQPTMKMASDPSRGQLLDISL